MRSSAEKVSYCALMTCVAMLLSYLEGMFAFVPINGFKLGLANIVIMLVFFTYGLKYAALVSFCRILLSALLFGSVVSLLFSLCGGILSLCAMSICEGWLKARVGAIGLGVLCAAFHDIGQCLAAAVFYGGSILWSYLPWLLLLSVPTGMLTGTAFYLISNKLNKLFYKKTNNSNSAE